MNHWLFFSSTFYNCCLNISINESLFPNKWKKLLLLLLIIWLLSPHKSMRIAKHTHGKKSLLYISWRKQASIHWSYVYFSAFSRSDIWSIYHTSHFYTKRFCVGQWGKFAWPTGHERNLHRELFNSHMKFKNIQMKTAGFLCATVSLGSPWGLVNHLSLYKQIRVTALHQSETCLTLMPHCILSEMLNVDAEIQGRECLRTNYEPARHKTYSIFSYLCGKI